MENDMVWGKRPMHRIPGHLAIPNLALLWSEYGVVYKFVHFE
jgi:hypothetical protein